MTWAIDDTDDPQDAAADPMAAATTPVDAPGAENPDPRSAGPLFRRRLRVSSQCLSFSSPTRQDLDDDVVGLARSEAA